MRGKTAQTRLGVKRQLNDHNIDDAMQRFENYERKMDDLEGQIEAYDMGQRTLADEIAELETDDAIDADLAELKSRMRGDSGPESASTGSASASNDQSANG
jgi:phage shock protein A